MGKYLLPCISLSTVVLLSCASKVLRSASFVNDTRTTSQNLKRA